MEEEQRRRKIVRLDETVVNRIAAGEIIHRPFNAVKEMIENSLDAGATSISVVLKGGGTKLLSITDDGHGIHKEDLSLVCERFATSKLREIDDLNSIQTYGFRGEALASISHVARVTIITRTEDSPCAYKVSYSDGKIVDPPGVKALAGNRGTIIIAEDLFYNVPMRKKALKNLAEEYTKTLEVLQKYAIHNAGVAFSCTKGNTLGSGSGFDLITQKGGKLTAKDNIGVIYGTPVARELMEIKLEDKDCGDDISLLHALVSNPNYSRKKGVFILFINHRLVDCLPLKRAIDSVYSPHLPKGSHPFVYLSICIPPSTLDVNVHPTKKEVRFLAEERIIEKIRVEIEKVLLSASHSRTFYTGSSNVLSFANAEPSSNRHSEGIADELNINGGSSQSKGRSNEKERETNQGDKEKNTIVGSSQKSLSPSFSQYYRPQQVVRTDSKAQTLDKFGIGPLQKVTANKIAEDGDICGGNGKNEIAVNEKQIVDLDSDLGSDDNDFEDLQEPPKSKILAQRTRKNNDIPTLEEQDEKPDFMDLDDDDDDDTNNNNHSNNNNADANNNNNHSNNNNADANSNNNTNNKGTKNKRTTKNNNQNPIDRPENPKKTKTDSNTEISTSSKPLMLTSIKNLISECKYNQHDGLKGVLKDHVYVGDVDGNLILAQHGTKLYLMDICSISRELMYQRTVYGFSQFARIRLSPAADIKALIVAALDSPCGGWREGDGDKLSIASFIAQDILLPRREMLSEYYSLDISPDGNSLLSIPLLIENHVPDLTLLPMLLLKLGTDVEWDHEQECFHSMGVVLSMFYSLEPIAPPNSLNETNDEMIPDPSDEQLFQTAREERQNTIKNVILPSVRSNQFHPPTSFADDGTVVQIACLEKLYRVFERC